MKRISVILVFLAGATLHAASIPEAVQGNFVIRDFKFVSGETLPEVRIHHRTIRNPRKDGKGAVRNAVLLLHGTTGSGKAFLAENFAGVLFGPGQLLDASKYFLIMPDGIGHDVTACPEGAGGPHRALEERDKRRVRRR
jgi:homoserine O-acetyltransferase/O-succinyltransferase